LGEYINAGGGLNGGRNYVLKISPEGEETQKKKSRKIPGGAELGARLNYSKETPGNQGVKKKGSRRTMGRDLMNLESKGKGEG